jgi:hypothetical protein
MSIGFELQKEREMVFCKHHWHCMQTPTLNFSHSLSALSAENVVCCPMRASENGSETRAFSKYFHSHEEFLKMSSIFLLLASLFVRHFSTNWKNSSRLAVPFDLAISPVAPLLFVSHLKSSAVSFRFASQLWKGCAVSVEWREKRRKALRRVQIFRVRCFYLGAPKAVEKYNFGVEKLQGFKALTTSQMAAVKRVQLPECRRQVCASCLLRKT